MTRARRTVPAAALLGLALVACGSTVPASQRVAVDGAGLGAASPGAAPGASLAPGATDRLAGSGGEGATPELPGAAPAGAPATASGGVDPVVAPSAAPQDRTPVRVGAFYINGGNAALGAGFASTPVNFGDGRLEAQAVVADINARGGIGGRPVQLFLQKFEAADASRPEAFDAACAALVQDHKVFAIVSIFNMRTPLAACAARHKVLLLSAALGAGDDEVYRRYGDWAYTPASMSLDAEHRLVLRDAFRKGVIGKDKRVGVVVQNDDEIFPRVFRNAIQPTLRALGVPFDMVEIATASDTSGIANAILKFQSSGARVVAFSAGNGGIPVVLFMQAAEQQQYRPAYVLGDSSDTWFVGGTAPREQAKRITGVGSYPLANVDADQHPSSPREKHCLEVISRAGQQVRDRHSSLTATFYCETLYGFAAAGARVRGTMTAEAWRSAYRSMGSAYPTILTFEVDVTRRPNVAARAYRTLAWVDECTCVAYTSPLARL